MRMRNCPWPPSLLEPRATFTTLMRRGALRGCCGTIEARWALVQDVWHNAWVSAYEDPRFPPVSPNEVVELDIAISVLTPLEPIYARNEAELIASLEPGVDGLVLSYGAARATFLPAVWQTIPEPFEFVARLKLKAGWSASGWWPGISALRYRAETFHSTEIGTLAA